MEATSRRRIERRRAAVAMVLNDAIDSVRKIRNGAMNMRLSPMKGLGF